MNRKQLGLTKDVQSLKNNIKFVLTLITPEYAKELKQIMKYPELNQKNIFRRFLLINVIIFAYFVLLTYIEYINQKQI